MWVVCIMVIESPGWRLHCSLKRLIQSNYRQNVSSKCDYMKLSILSKSDLSLVYIRDYCLIPDTANHLHPIGICFYLYKYRVYFYVLFGTLIMSLIAFLLSTCPWVKPKTLFTIFVSNVCFVSDFHCDQ